MHNEWIKTNLENLRGYFKPTYNETEILVNVEKKAKYPFVIFGDPGVKFNASNGVVDPFLIMPTATSINLSHELRITDGLLIFQLQNVLFEGTFNLPILLFFAFNYSWSLGANLFIITLHSFLCFDFSH